MKWLLLMVGILVVPVAVLFVFGLLQPVKHSVKRSIRLRQRPETVFAVLEQPDWSGAVEKCERLPDQDGKVVTRCTLKWGHIQMIVTQLERTPPTRLVLGMAKENGVSLGTWTYEIAGEGNRCSVTLTEAGELKNPFFRGIARLRGLDTNIKQTLRDLAQKFGEPVEIPGQQ